MQNMPHTPRYLQCLIGLRCRIMSGESVYRIIDVKPDNTKLVVHRDGIITYASLSQIRLIEESRIALERKFNEQTNWDRIGHTSAGGL